MDVIRLAAVGTGSRFRALAGAVKLAGGMEIVLLCDKSADHLKRAQELMKEELPSVRDYDKVISNKEIDGVLIATPNSVHADQVVRALQAGKHVLCEKPMATTIPDARRMVGAARKSKAIMMVGLQMRHHVWAAKVKELVVAGKIGTPRMTWCTEWREQFRKSKDWVFTEALSGGAIVEKNCHHFDLFNWWTDSRPARVAAFGGIGPFQEMLGRTNEIVDHAFIISEFENSVRAMIGICFFGNHAGVGREMGITGDESTIIHSRRNSQESFILYPREGQWETIHVDAYDRGNEILMERFREAIRGTATPSPTAEMGYESILAPVAAEIAMKDKRVVTIAEIERKS